jgi:parallel beta-helix repeat protein
MLLNQVRPCSAGKIDVYQTDSIQEAIDAASPGDTVFVHNGTYYEHIIINKTISLIGENPANTTLDGNMDIIPIVRIFAQKVTFCNFTVRNTASDWETYGIYVRNTQNISLVNNIVKETYTGIRLENSSHCQISNNTMTLNFAYGIHLIYYAMQNLFTGNNIMENPSGAYLAAEDCQNNTFYHNNFVNNIYQVSNFGSHTSWDNGYPFGGNYWSDYEERYPNAKEIDDSGIWDTPYNPVEFGVQDNYPLMNPWVPIPPIANFTYSPENPTKDEIITFNASASYDPDGTIISYKWDFGDNTITTTTNQTITHSYPEFSNYSVTLTITDDDSLKDKMIKTVKVQAITSTLTIKVFPEEIEIGKNATISGNLTIRGNPAKGENIEILTKIQGQNNWTTFVTVPTGSKGTYQNVWTPITVTTYEIMASWKGNETVLPANSSAVTLDVRKRSSKLTIYATPTTVTIGSNITITGRLTPVKEGGANITIDYQIVSFPLQFTLWKNIATVRTNSTGDYICVWSPIKADVMYLFQASWQGDEQTLESSDLSGFVTVNKMSSNITIDVNQIDIILNSNITISGKINPERFNVTVTIQISLLNGTNSWNVTTTTNQNGEYECAWKPPSSGSYQIKASWDGDNSTMPAQSDPLTINVEAREEMPGIYTLIGIIAIVLVAVVIWKIRRR